MQVTFTQHAIQRLQQRLNLNVPQNTRVNIAPLFTKAYSYINHTNGRKVSAWVSKDALKKCVLVVDSDKSAVVTVYLEIDPATNKKCPFCAKCYAMLTH
jgi:hypothetical protein